MSNFQVGDRVIVTTANVAGVLGTIGEGKNQGQFCGKLDDGRYFQAKASQLQRAAPPSAQTDRDQQYTDVVASLTPSVRRMLGMLTGSSANTQELARLLDASTTATAAVLMGLVRQGILDYTPRTALGGYATWFLTPKFREYHNRENIRRFQDACNRTAAQVTLPKPEPVKVTEYILWCPTSSLPVTTTYPTLFEAQRVAKIMAKKNPGKEFKIAGIVKTVQLKTEKVTTEVQTLVIS